MEVFFQMRFSYCGKPTGLVNRKARQSRKFNEDDVLQQFEMLERLTLPSLRDQKDPAFRLVLLSSDRMPDACKDHLTWLLNHYLPGRSQVLYARPLIPGRVFRHFMQQHARGQEPVIQTQVLDGDAFGERFVRTLREHAIENWSAEAQEDKRAASKGTFMTFRRGLNLRMQGKKITGLEPTALRKTPFGLSLVARAVSRYNPALINPDGLGVKFPHVSIRTKRFNCLRIVTGKLAQQMPPIEEQVLAQAQQDFGVLRLAHDIPVVDDRPLPKPVDVDAVVRMRKTA